MRTLVLMRHSHALDGADDRARALSGRGRVHAQERGKALADAVSVDHVLCSVAERARQTYDCVAPSLAQSAVTFVPSLYLAGPSELLAAIRAAPDSANTLLLIAHNPGLSEVAARLGRGSAPMRGLRPADAVVLDTPAASWAAFSVDDCQLRLRFGD